MVRPYLRTSQPIPPPRVSPAMPTEPVSPNGVARPWAAAAIVYSSARQTGLRPGEAALGIDVEALHRAEVEDDAAVVRAVAGEAVAAAADRQREAGLARQDDGPGDVGRVGRADDQRRAPVGVRAVDLAGHVVVGAAGQDDRAVQTGLEGFEVERVVGLGAGGAEGFHERAPWWCGRCGRCAPSSSPGRAGAADARRVAGMDIRRRRRHDVADGRGRSAAPGASRASGPRRGARSRRSAPRPRGSPPAASNRSARTPDEDRPDREAEVAPEAVDAGDRAALPRLGDVGDDGEQRRVDHRRAEAEDDRRQRATGRTRSSRRSPRWRRPGASIPATISRFRPIRSESAPVAIWVDAPGRRVGAGQDADLRRGSSPAAAQTIGSRPQAIASFRLLTRPACDTADSERSETVLRQASRSQRGSAGRRRRRPLARSRGARGRASRGRTATDAPSPSPTIAIPRKNGAGRRPADSAMTPVRKATTATAR